MDTKLGIKKKSWKDLRASIKLVNQEFFNIVENIGPDADCYLYEVNFPYGSLIGDHVSQFLPLNKEGYIRLNDPSIDKEIIKDLGYGMNNSPIGMVVNKKFELYLDLPEKKAMLPFMVLSPGDFFSFNHLLDIGPGINYAPNGILYGISGGRSCFLLPSINCQSKFSRLCRALEIKVKRPSSFYEHHNLFKRILNSQHIDNKWTSTIIYFSEAWIKNIKNHPDWYALKEYFHKLYTRRALFPLNTSHYNTAYSLLLEKRNFKPNPYIFDTFKHIIQIMCGQSPGLSPLVDEELVPLRNLQQVFEDYYSLNETYPTIMGPSLFDPFSDSADPIYYSLQIPTTSSFSPKSKNSSVMVELKELLDLCETLLSELKCDKGFCANTIIQHIAKYLSISYHHNSQDIDNIILPTNILVEQDHRFGKNCGQLAAENGKFFRGCIKIYKNNVKSLPEVNKS